MKKTKTFSVLAGFVLMTTGFLPANRASVAKVASLDVALTVKENFGAQADGYPVSAVVPLPRGQFFVTSALGMAGAPSQVEPLEKWPDGSLRHVLVHFQPTVAANSDAIYHFTDGGQLAPPAPVQVSESSGEIAVNTGPLRFVVSKTAFNILDQAWIDQNNDGIFSGSEQIVTSDAQNGGVFAPRSGAGGTQYDAARSSPQVTIEERGPMRAVIKVEAPAQFITTTNHLHGFATRIYAYAGKPYVKVDYQLQNSDKTVVRSWPLYFESMNLDLRVNLSGPTNIRIGKGDGTVFGAANTNGVYLAQEMHNTYKIRDGATNAALYDSGVLPDSQGPDGFIDVSDASRGVMAAIRNFWQTWPNGLAVDSANKLSAEMFPDWGAQWYDHQISPSGLYWLNDMQHYYKEALFNFHAGVGADGDLVNLARLFQFPPVAVVPADWHRQAQATLDLGGALPPQSAITSPDEERLPEYMYPEKYWWNTYWYSPTHGTYGAGFANFYDPEPGYRSASCTTGGWPYSAAGVVATSNPGDYFMAEGWAQAELNLRPEWLTGYDFEADWPSLQLTENPYCGGTWRIFEGHGISTLAAPPLPGTGGETSVYYARDDEHGWFYHVAEAYWLTGNPWIKDWYTFIAQFRQTRLKRLDPWPDRSSRATAHALNHALQAYRITGDGSLLDDISAHIHTYLLAEQDPFYGDQLESVESSGGGFQTGYLARFVADYLEEVRAAGKWQAYAEGFNYLSGLMEWNKNFGNFPYYFNARAGGTSTAGGSGFTLVDPQSWYYWHTGKQGFWDHVDGYVSGANGGETPYGNFADWRGQYEGRFYLMVKNTARPDAIPPTAIANLSASVFSGTVTLSWMAPADAARYHIVWSDKPIVEPNSMSASVTNWWAAHAVGPSLIGAPGTTQSWTFHTDGAGPIYAAIFSFDAADNMSAISNIALAQNGSPPYRLFLPTTIKGISASW